MKIRLALLLFIVALPSFAEPPVEKNRALPQWYLGFGPTTLGHLNAEGIGLGLEGAHAWDVNVAVIRIFSTFAIRGSSYFGQLGLGVSRFLMDTETAPYLAADLGYGFAKATGSSLISGESTTGFVLGFGAGLQMFRNADVNVDVGFRLAFLLSDTAFGNPNLAMLRVGLYF